MNNEDMVDYIVRRAIRGCNWHKQGIRADKSCHVRKRESSQKQKAKKPSSGKLRDAPSSVNMTEFLSETSEQVWNKKKLKALMNDNANIDESAAIEERIHHSSVEKEDPLTSSAGTVKATEKDAARQINKAMNNIASSSCLGAFLKLIIDLSSNKSDVTCTCHYFRRDTTCDHSRFFGLLCAEQFPSPKCVK